MMVLVGIVSAAAGFIIGAVLPVKLLVLAAVAAFVVYLLNDAEVINLAGILGAQ